MPQSTSIDRANQLIHNTHKMNQLSALPGVGQIIGLATVAINIVKIFADVSLLIALNISSIKQGADNTEFWEHKKVEQDLIKINMVHHLKYIGIGLTRLALPIIGGLTLAATHVHPIKEYEFTKINGETRVTPLWAKYRPKESNLKSELTLLAIPVVGQIFAVFNIIVRTAIMAGRVLVLSVWAIKIKISDDSDPFQRLRKRSLHETIRDLKNDLKLIGVSMVGGALPIVGALSLLSGDAVIGSNEEYNEEGTVTTTHQAQEQAKREGYVRHGKHTKRKLDLSPTPADPKVSEWITKQNPPQLRDNPLPLETNKKRLALILGDTLISGSEWEGGNPSDAIGFWNNLVDCTTTINHGMTPAEQQTIKDDFADIKKLDFRSMDENSIKDRVEYIQQRLKQRGRCVIPLMTTVGDSGHASAVVIERRADGRLHMYHLNVGEGSEDFPLIEIDSKQKRSFRTHKRILMPKLFTGEDPDSDIKLISLITQISVSNPEKHSATWTTKLLQDIFFKLSTPDETDVIPRSHAVTAQRSGTCSEQLARLLIRDNLIHKNPENLSTQMQQAKYKRGIAAGKFEALKSINALLKEDKIPIMLAKSLVFASSHTFSQDIKQHLLNEGEIAVLGELMDETLQLITTKSEAGYGVPAGSTLAAEPITFREGVAMRPTLKAARKTEVEKPQYPIALKPGGCTDVATLRRLLLLTKNVYALVRHLPIPSADPANPDFYSSLSEEDAKFILLSLRILSTNLEPGSLQQHLHAEVQITMLHIAAVSNALMARIPGLRTQNYAMHLPANADLSSCWIQFGDEQARFKQIIAYFKAQENKKDLFRFYEVDRQKLPEYLSGKIEGEHAEHIDDTKKYLEQFLTPDEEHIISETAKTHMLFEYLKVEDPDHVRILKRDLQEFAKQRAAHNKNFLSHGELLTIMLEQSKAMTFSRKEAEVFMREFVSYCKSHSLESLGFLSQYKMPSYFHTNNNTFPISTPGEDFYNLSSIYKNLARVLYVKVERVVLGVTLKINAKDTLSIDLYIGGEHIPHKRFNPGELPKDENDAMIEEDDVIRADFMRMEHADNSSVGALISWVNLHPVLPPIVEDEDGLVYPWIERLFLADGQELSLNNKKENYSYALSFVKSIAAEPQQRKNFHQMILRKINDCSISDAAIIGFWMRIAVWCESRVAQVPGEAVDVKFLNEIKAVLNQKLAATDNLSKDEKKYQALIYLYMSYMDLYDLQPDPDRIVSFVTNLFKAHLLKPNITALMDNGTSGRTGQDFQQRRELLEINIYDLLTSPSLRAKRNQIGNAILGMAGIGKTNLAWTLTNWPILSAKDGGNEYSIDLKTNELYFNDLLVNKVAFPNKLLDLAKKLGIDPSTPLLRTQSCYVALDGSFEITLDDEEFPRIRKKFDFHPDGLLQYSHDTDNPKARKDDSMFNDLKKKLPALFANNQLWFSSEKSYVVNKEGQIVATIEYNKGVVKKEGGALWHASDPSTIDPKVTQFFDLTADPKDIIYWCKDGRLAQVEFPLMGGAKFNATYDKDGNVTFECHPHKGYVLAPTQGFVGSVLVPGALTLVDKNDPKKVKCLVPATALKDAHPTNEFSTYATVGFDFSKKPCTDEGYFTYEINPADQALFTADPTAALFLSYLHQARGEFVLAKYYLDRVPAPQTLPTYSKVIDYMKDVKIKSPQATAFMLHLVLHEKEGNTGIDLNSKADEIAENQQFFSHINQDALPEALMLSESQMRTILPPKLSNAFHANDTPHKTLFEAQLSDVRSLAIDMFRPDEDSFRKLFSKMLSSPPNPKYERFTFEDVTVEKYLEKNFKNLFASALGAHKRFGLSIGEVSEFQRSGEKILPPNIFDAELEYLFNCNTTLDKDARRFLVLLYFVRQHPEHFSDINFDESTSPAQVQKLMENIILRFNNLLAPYAAPSKVVTTTDNPMETVSPAAIRGAVKKLPIPQSEEDALPSVANAIIAESFTTTVKPVFGSSSDFAIKTQPASRIGGKLMDQIRAVFTQQVNQRKGTHFRLVAGKTPESLKQDVDVQLTNLASQSKEIAQRIKALANSPRSEDIPASRQKEYRKHQVKKGERHDFGVTLNDVLLGVGVRDTKALFQKNPFLTPEILAELNHLSIQYMQNQSQVSQLSEARGHIDAAITTQDPKHINDAGKILAKKRSYDPLKWPELIFYEYSTGIMLRDEPDQAQLLIRLFDGLFKENKTEQDKAEISRIAFEFQAGGGKTKVLSVILAAKAIALGKIPIFLSLPSLFDIVREDLREMLVKVFNKNVKKIDINLATKLDYASVRRYLALIQRAREDGTCLVITPEAFHSLNLAGQRALSDTIRDPVPGEDAYRRAESNQQNKELYNLIQACLKELKQHGVFLIDEAHHNVDALRQTNMAVGTKKSIDKRERNLISLAYQFMSGTHEKKLALPDGRSVAGILKIGENKQAQMDQKDKELAIEVVVEQLLNHIKFDPPISRQVLIAYLKDLEAVPPSEIVASPDRNVIALLKGLRWHLLPFALNKVGEMDYGKGTDAADLVAAPREQKKTSESKFENSYLASALTCQMTYQEGITHPAAFVQALKMLLAGRNRNKERFKEYEKATGVDFLAISNSDMDHREKLKLLMDKLSRFPPLMHIYLECIALPYVQTYPKKMTSTGSDLINAPWASVMFSATLGITELYPLAAEDSEFWEDPGFLADVSQRLCMDQNKEVHYVEPTTPYALLEELFGGDLDKMKNVEGLIDLGYWSKGSTTRSWAEAFNKFAKAKKQGYDGAVFLDLDKQGVKRLYFLPIDSNTPLKLKSTNLKEELAKLGTKSEKVFKIYAPDETTGTDLLLSPTARMIVSVGENTTLSSAAQAVLRMRGFLADHIDLDRTQSTLFVAPRQQQVLIETNPNADPMEQLVCWMVENEANKLKDTILSNAKQDIEALARSYVAGVLKSTGGGTAEFKLHAEALVFDSIADPFSMYGKPSSDESTGVFLTKYAAQFFQKARIPDEIILQLNEKVKIIIENAEANIEKVKVPLQGLESTARQEVSAFQQQEQEQVNQQQQQQQQQANMIEGLKAIELMDYAEPSKEADLMHISTANSQYLIPSNNFKPGFPNPPEHLYFAANIKNLAENINYQKTADFLLALEENGEQTFIACTFEDAEKWIEQIRKGAVRKDLKVCLLGMDGSILQNGKNSAALALRTDELKDILVYCNLMNGVISDVQGVKNRIDQNPKAYMDAWNTRQAVHVDGLDRFNTALFTQILEDTKVI